MLLKAREVMTPDRPIKCLSRQYLKVHTHGRRGFKVRFPQDYFDSSATAMEMVGCGSRAVSGRKKSGPTVGQVGQDQRTLGDNDHSIPSWSWKTDSMKSTSSVFTRIDGFPIAVNAQLQDTHTQSSGESEFYVLGAGCADGLYVKVILDDLGMQAKINLRCDAKAARALAERQGLSKRTRHVKVKYFYVQDLVKAREVEVSRVATETNLADMGTKHLPSHRLEFLKSLMGKTSQDNSTDLTRTQITISTA